MLHDVRTPFYMDKQELEEAMALPDAMGLRKVFEGALAEVEAADEKDREVAARVRVAKREKEEREYVPKRERGRFDGWSAEMLKGLVQFLGGGADEVHRNGESHADQ